MASTISDELLIQQAQSGRQAAFGTLVRRYESYAFTLAFRFVKNREDATEVAQDAFLRAFRYLPDFRGESKFSTWLYKIIYSTSLNFLKKNRPELASLDDESVRRKVADFGTPDAAQTLEQEDRQSTIRRAIELLSPDDAGIITLFYLYEHNLEEICQIMDLSLSNAKTKLCRARQRLKAILENKFEEVAENR